MDQIAKVQWTNKKDTGAVELVKGQRPGETLVIGDASESASAGNDTLD
jgi:hypothetical protein